MMTINLDIDLIDYFTNKYTIAKEIINIKQSINNMIMENVTVDIVKKAVDETVDVVDETTVTVSETINAVDESIATTVSETVDAVDETVDIVDETVDVVDNDLIETIEIINEETNEPQQIIYQYANEYVKNKIANSRTQNLPHVFSTRNGFTSDYVESIKTSDIKPFNIDPSIFEKPSKKQKKKKVIAEKNIQGIQFVPSKQSEAIVEVDVSKFASISN